MLKYFGIKRYGVYNLLQNGSKEKFMGVCTYICSQGERKRRKERKR